MHSWLTVKKLQGLYPRFIDMLLIFLTLTSYSLADVMYLFTKGGREFIVSMKRGMDIWPHNLCTNRTLDQEKREHILKTQQMKLCGMVMMRWLIILMKNFSDVTHIDCYTKKSGNFHMKWIIPLLRYKYGG